jgi:predicted glycoside hydrolase/deacetylase ChbG (UPF0249 family)
VSAAAGAAAGATPASGARRWVSCADDFAIDGGAVDAIVELIAQGRVTATSALVDAPLWPSAARQLPERPTADIGLHLNLTQRFTPHTAGIWPLRELIWRCATGRLPHAPLQAAIARQLDAFEAQRGRPPDYIDGHQHVHQFGVVRDALIAELQRRYPGRPLWVRSTRPPPGVRDTKARGIALLGDRGLRAQAAAARLPVSAYLVGVYDFGAGSAAERATYRARVTRWLDSGPDGSVLMCHPAARAQADDPIGTARVMEYALLRGSEWAATVQRANILLVRGSELFASGPA